MAEENEVAAGEEDLGLREEEEEEEEEDNPIRADVPQQQQQQQQQQDQGRPVIRNPLDPRRMELSEEELGWAWAIKNAIEQDPEIENLSDMKYGQLALMDKGQTARAVERARHMQTFLEEYKLLDTLEDGRKWMGRLLQLLKPVFLSYSYNHNEGNYVFVYDLGVVDLSVFNNQSDGFETSLSGGYYFCHALAPDFEAVRRGVIFIAECRDFDWRRNLDIGAFKRFWGELMAHYPYNVAKIKYFNSGMFINMVNSLKKRFLPREITDRMEYGCQFDGRLSDVYLVPNVDAATARMQFRLEDSLARRYERERLFRLPPPHD